MRTEGLKGVLPSGGSDAILAARRRRKEMNLVGKVIVVLLILATAATMTFAAVTLANAAIVGDPPLSQIGNHTPPIFDTISMTFTLDAIDADFGIAEGVFPPVGGFAVSVWGFNELFGGFYLFGDTTPPIEEDFSLISGYNAAGQIGTYQLIADVNANNPLDYVDPSKGYYFRIVDQYGEVTFIGAGGQQFTSEADVQSNTIFFGSDTIGPSPPPAPPVGGIVTPVNKFALLAPWIALGTTLVAIAVIVAYTARRIIRKAFQ